MRPGWGERIAALRVPPAAVVVGLAAGLATCARALVYSVGVPTGLAFHVVMSLLAAAIIGVCVLFETRFVVHEITAVRELSAAHPKAAARVRRAVAAAALVVAIAVVLALTTQGWIEAVARAVAVAGVACLFGTVTTLLATWGFLWPDRRRGWRRIAVVGAPVLSVATFLQFEDLTVGHTMFFCCCVAVLVLWALMLAGKAEERHLGPGTIAAVLVFLVRVTMTRPPRAGVVTHWVAEALIGCTLGAATAVPLWRRLRRARRPLPRLAGVATSLALAALLFLLFDDQLLGGPLEAPLFPLAVWLSVRLWRWMADQEQDRPAIGAGADIALALLLGAVLVSFLVWLANLLDLPDAEVAALRATADTIGNLIDLPWWLWAGVYAVLAALYLVPALGPARYQRIAVRVAKLRLVPTVNALQRGMNGAGIGLMLVALLGLAAPPSVGAVLSRSIRERVGVDTTRQVASEGETDLYQAVLARFRQPTSESKAFVELLLAIHDADPPPAGDDHATSAELDLAHRMGQVQAQVLLVRQRVDGSAAPDSPDPDSPAAEPPAEQADLDRPLAGAADLKDRLGTEQREARLAEDRHEQAEAASELAATAVTNALDSLTLGRGEVLSVVREYLDGIAESPLHETFLAWVTRVRSGRAPTTPPAATEVVEPDPTELRVVADVELIDEMGSTGNVVGTDPAARDAAHDSPIEGAVRMVEETREIQLSGSCTGCEHLPEPDGPGGDEEHEEIHGE